MYNGFKNSLSKTSKLLSRVLFTVNVKKKKNDWGENVPSVNEIQELISK